MGSIRRRTDNNLLFLDFRYRDIRCREQTALPDTAANRKKVQKVLDRIEADIAAGTRRDGSAFERLITQSIASQALPVEALKENCDV